MKRGKGTRFAIGLLVTLCLLYKKKSWRDLIPGPAAGDAGSGSRLGYDKLGRLAEKPRNVNPKGLEVRRLSKFAPLQPVQVLFGA